MTRQVTFLMCSPRGEKSGSYSLGNYFSGLLEEKGLHVKSFHTYKTLKKEKSIEEMIESVNESDIILISTPLYIDQAPHMTIKLMDEITEAKNNGRISEKKRLLTAIVCAGFLEYYHNEIAIKIYQQFAKKNDFTWAGGFPIGAAGTYASYSILEILEMVKTLPQDDYRQFFYGKPAKILDDIFHKAVKCLERGEKISDLDLKELEIIPIPIESYVKGGNEGWIEWAKQLGTADKLRDKPYEQKD